MAPHRAPPHKGVSSAGNQGAGWGGILGPTRPHPPQGGGASPQTATKPSSPKRTLMRLRHPAPSLEPDSSRPMAPTGLALPPEGAGASPPSPMTTKPSSPEGTKKMFGRQKSTSMAPDHFGAHKAPPPTGGRGKPPNGNQAIQPQGDTNATTPPIGRSGGRTDRRSVGWSDGRPDGRTAGRSAGRTDGRTDGRSVGRSDGTK